VYDINHEFKRRVDDLKKYILRRILLSIIVLFGVVVITFIVTRVIPSDPAAKWAGPRATVEQIANARLELGLDQPVYTQFAIYVNNLLHGNLGYSLKTHNSVTDELLTYIPATLELVLISTILALTLGVLLGLYSARYKDKLLDHFCRFFSIGVVSLPSFWIALSLQMLFYGVLNILPLGGRLSTEITIMYEIPHITGMLLFDSLITGNFVIFKDALMHIILPVIPISLYPIGTVARLTRSAVLEILGEDYITASRSYGLSENFILWFYALKNSLGPTVTVVTLSIGYTLVNTFLVESIFSWPGIGKYISSAIMNLDFPAIMGVTLFSAVTYLVLNLVADLIISLDPRVRIK